MITSHKTGANGIGTENYDLSTELTTMLVPIGLIASFKETRTEYQNQRRNNPNYVDALYDTVVLSDAQHMFANVEEVIDAVKLESLFFNLNELVAAFKDEPCLPKAVVTSLLKNHADVVLKLEKLQTLWTTIHLKKLDVRISKRRVLCSDAKTKKSVKRVD